MGQLLGGGHDMKIQLENELNTSKKIKLNISKILLYIVLIVFSITMILPFVWMISASLKPEVDVFTMPIKWIPDQFRWSNYKEVWTRVPFLSYYTNTVIVAVAITAAQVMTCSLAAYSFSKIVFKERDFLFMGYLGTLMVPFTVIMIPQFIVIQKLGLIDNIGALILLGSFSPFGVFLFRQFFMSIPEELSEAARIDGCNDFGIYAKIIMPNAKPAVGSLIIFTFIYAWNDFLGPLIYISSDANRTLQLGIRTFQTMYTQDYALLMAAAVCAMLPTIIVYLLAQDLFVKGVAMTGMKG